MDQIITLPQFAWAYAGPGAIRKSEAVEVEVAVVAVEVVEEDVGAGVDVEAEAVGTVLQDLRRLLNQDILLRYQTKMETVIYLRNIQS